MTLLEAVEMSLARFASFGGRARRAEYWYFTLFHSLVISLAMVVSYLVWLVIPALAIILYSVVVFGTLLPHLAVSVRRLHDVNRTGWWYLVGCVPLVGAIVLLMGACDTSSRLKRGMRFDKVAVGLIAENGRGLTDRVRVWLEGRNTPSATSGNAIRVCIVNGRQEREPNVRGFVHNPDVDVQALFDEVQKLIAMQRPVG